MGCPLYENVIKEMSSGLSCLEIGKYLKPVHSENKMPPSIKCLYRKKMYPIISMK